MNHVELYTFRDQLNIEIKFKLKLHVAKWSYGLRSGLPGFFLGSPGNFQGALWAPWIFSREPKWISGSFFSFFVVNLSVLSHFSLYFLLKHFTSSGNSNNKPPVHSNCQTAQVLFIQSNNQFLFKKCFFFFFFVVNSSILRHFSLYFLLKHFTSSGNSNNKPPMHSNSPGFIQTIK